MSEEEDYMSDNFLNNYESKDICPGLVSCREKRRKIELVRKKNESDNKNKLEFVSTKTLELDRRSEGLEKPIGPDNKGFAMLQKMGFKPGTSLGASRPGIVEPISVVVKNNRIGLGREDALLKIRARKQTIQEKRKSNVVSVDDYRLSLSKKFKEREVNSDLFKSEKACFKLDSESGVTEPEEAWFWPENVLHALTEEETEDESTYNTGEDFEYQPCEKLEMLTMYLRQTYCYCIWCGVQFEDEKDLSSNCPGSTRDDH